MDGVYPLVGARRGLTVPVLLSSHVAGLVQAWGAATLEDLLYGFLL